MGFTIASTVVLPGLTRSAADARARLRTESRSAQLSTPTETNNSVPQLEYVVNDLERAIEMAVEAHEGERDKAGETYIRYQLRVM